MELKNQDFMNMFLSAKDIEGCSKRTIKYYKDIIEKFLSNIGKSINYNR